MLQIIVFGTVMVAFAAFASYMDIRSRDKARDAALEPDAKKPSPREPRL